MLTKEHSKYKKYEASDLPLGVHNPDSKLENGFITFTRFLGQQLALHKHIKLRHRYVFTRQNKVRLRYISLCTTMLVLAMTPIFMVTSASIAVARYDSGSRVTNMVALGSSAEAEGDNALMVLAAAMPTDGSVIAPDEGSNTSLVEKIAGSFQRHISFPTVARKPELPSERVVKLDVGDTVAGVLQNAGVSSAEAYRAVKAMSSYYDPRLVKPGQEISLHFAPAVAEDTPRNLQKMEMKIDPVKQVVVRKDGETSFRGELAKKELEQKNNARFASIETSLYGSALRAEIPAPIVAELIRIYSWDVDFQRDIRQGDKIEVLYDTFETEDGDLAKYGDVLYASLTVGGKPLPVYRYKTADGRVDYYEPNGQSIKKALMKTPIDGARLSSGYGMRKHPVLGYNKMHKGSDFAAPVGTPIYAAGDGVIEKMERYNSYGNYVRIRHNSTLKTAYAHMHKFAPKLGAGKRVEQGQIIGYVGTTGRSTGPHLHYEVLVQNEQVNPNRVDLPIGEKLKGTELTKFKSIMSSASQLYASLTSSIKYAHNNVSDNSHIQ